MEIRFSEEYHCLGIFSGVYSKKYYSIMNPKKYSQRKSALNNGVRTLSQFKISLLLFPGIKPINISQFICSLSIKPTSKWKAIGEHKLARIVLSHAPKPS
jgi:hypothetical protein